MRVLPGLSWRTVGRESVAGVTLLAIAVPLNIGYAQIAGLPPTAGLYALILPSILYAFVVSSRQLVASPDAAAAALVASSLVSLAVAGSADYITFALAQALLCGLMFGIAAVFKLGFLANFLSKPILVGFVGGLALDIMVSQIAKMLGIKIDSGADFVDKVVQLFQGLDTINWWSVAISLVSIAILVGGRRISPVVPWALIVLVVMTLIVVFADLHDTAGVAVLGEVDAGPPTLTWPVISWIHWLELIPSALALTLVTMAEGLLVARSYGEKRNYRTSPNRDLLAFGVANAAAGVSGGFSVGSSTSRTAAMDQVGSRTQWPSIITAIGTLLLVMFGTGLLEDIPSPAIGAIVAVAIVGLLGIAEFRQLFRLDRSEFLIGAVCFAGTLFLGAIPGILIAFVLALINLASRASKPPIDLLADDDSAQGSLLPANPTITETAPGVVVLRFAAPLFFGNASVFADAVEKAVNGAHGHVSHLVLDLEAVTDIDVTGAESMQTTQQWLVAHDVSLTLTRVRPDTVARLRQLHLLAGVPTFATNREALAALGADTTDRKAQP